ncbi:MAG: DUF1501 domain-containing protein, partial [Phycisphaerae bacterium]
MQPDRNVLWKNLLEQASRPEFYQQNAHLFSRRALLTRSFNGIGALGLAASLGLNDSSLKAAQSTGSSTRLLDQPVTPHPARAKHIIHLWMNGAPSQVDTFDPKPSLERYAGQRPEST